MVGYLTVAGNELMPIIIETMWKFMKLLGKYQMILIDPKIFSLGLDIFD